MRKSERYNLLIEHFKQQMPNATTELYFGSVFQLLVATMLSAQCTDKRVNMVTPILFAHYPDARTMSEAKEEDIFELVKSISYPNAKSHNLKLMSIMLMERFNGEVPSDIERLVSLPGVGRKTANVILAVGFEKPAMPVDTHVFRVSHRLGLVSKSAGTPLAVERELRKHIPEEFLSKAHHWLLLHGRYVCTSRSPHCAECQISSICPRNPCKN